LFNVLIEFAGLNSYFNPNNTGKSIDPNKEKVIKTVESQGWIWVIVLLICIILSYLAYLKHDFNIFYNNEGKFNWFLFGVEMTIFSYFNTLPLVLIANNRNSNMTM
jgi:hypothetical protein